jgi:hypothetical protein
VRLRETGSRVGAAGAGRVLGTGTEAAVSLPRVWPEPENLDWGAAASSCGARRPPLDDH